MCEEENVERDSTFSFLCYTKYSFLEVNVMDEIQAVVNKFVNDRDWDQYHQPEKLAMSISIEAAELLEHYQWGYDGDEQGVKEELADVLIYCFQMCDKIGVRADDIIKMKMKKNEEKYPVEKAKGVATKYDKL